MDCAVDEYCDVFGISLNHEQKMFLAEWERLFRIGMDEVLDDALFGDPRRGYHQFLFDDDGA